jgi:excisionase family DNA binding protein
MSVDNTLEKEALLTAKDVRDILKVSRAQVDRLMASGQLKRVKIGRALRFRRSDIESYINSVTQ